MWDLKQSPVELILLHNLKPILTFITDYSGKNQQHTNMFTPNVEFHVTKNTQLKNNLAKS